MSSNFNRQFYMLDYELMGDPEFVQFIGSREHPIYLLLRKHINRGDKNHPLKTDLQQIYEQERKLPSVIDNRTIIKALGGRDATWISKQLTKLVDLGLIERRRTGRENIYVLGEWIDISEPQDGSKRIEWFYLDRRFGKKLDLALDTKSDFPKSPIQQPSDLASDTKSDLPKTPIPNQTWPKTPNHYKEEYNVNEVNGIVNNVSNVNVVENDDLAQSANQQHFQDQSSHLLDRLSRPTSSGRDGIRNTIETKRQTYQRKWRDNQAEQANPVDVESDESSKLKGFEALKALPDLDQEQAKIDHITNELAEYFDDQKSLAAFKIIAQKIPLLLIDQTRKAIRQDGGAKSEIKVFMSQMGKRAEKLLAKDKSGDDP